MTSTKQLRKWWKKYECQESLLTRIGFLGDQIKVAPETVDAWRSLEQVMKAHDYYVGSKDTGSYNCRFIAGTKKKSLHSYGIALDVNWKTNPWKDHQGFREVVFSDKNSQAERAKDVIKGKADTDMTSGMIADILAIKTVDGKRVFDWGGTWNGVKDSMHFEIDLSPKQLSRGIRGSTVVVDLEAKLGTSDLDKAEKLIPYNVIARDGLRLRSGPGTDFDVLQLLPFDMKVIGLKKYNNWMMVSINNDNIADGYVYGSFLKSAALPSALWDISNSARTGVNNVTWSMVAQLFHPSARKNVKKNWSYIKRGLQKYGIFDAEILAMENLPILVKRS